MYNARWLGHHGNRLYGFMGLQSKMSEWMGEWMDGYPLDLMTTRAPVVLKKEGYCCCDANLRADRGIGNLCINHLSMIPAALPTLRPIWF